MRHWRYDTSMAGAAKMAPALRRLSVRLTREDLQKLRVMAAQRDTSMQALVARWIEQKVKAA